MTDRGMIAAVIGGGPAGLMAAEAAGDRRLPVTVYDRMPSVGRKLLMAGRGGLNLTHSEPLDRLLERYGADQPRLRAAIARSRRRALRAWCDGLGADLRRLERPRVPDALKASPLLRAWLRRLGGLGVEMRPPPPLDRLGRRGLALRDARTTTSMRPPRATMLAIGGASWPRLGSDGGFDVSARDGIAMTPLRPANCGFAVALVGRLARASPAPRSRALRDRSRRPVRQGRGLITHRASKAARSTRCRRASRGASTPRGGPILPSTSVPTWTPTLAERLARRRQGLALDRLRKAAGLSPAAIGLIRRPPARPLRRAAADARPR